MTEPDHTAHYALCEEIVDALRADLLGPVGGPHEILHDDAPITVYPVGVLFPRAEDREAAALAADERAEIDGLDTVPLNARSDREEPAQDVGVEMANTRRPSSMGLTFVVAIDVSPTVVLAVEAAVYVPQDDQGRPVEARRNAARSIKGQNEHWRREPLVIVPVEVDVTQPGVRDPHELSPGLELRVLVRPVAPDGTVTVTATTVNALAVGVHDLRDAHCFYQPVLTVTAGDGRSAAFVERPTALGAVDAEQALSRMLHRHAPGFATGHGCAAGWDWTPPPIGAPVPERAAVTSVRTEFVPSQEVLLTDSNPEIDSRTLAMGQLADAASHEVVAALRGLLDGYEQWIERQRSVSADLDAVHEATAGEQIARCGRTLRRMRRGIDLLADPDRPDILRAFQLANAVMAEQRARAEWIKQDKQGLPDREAGRWRPFQIAFVLLCLEGIVDARHADRGAADLLWFPTGGGKTEAYLGLIAFTTFLRRLRDGRQGGGVTVLMRYTLRLLTLQQFERAAALICAMELERRRSEAELGAEPISIGMWVGRSATPNTLAEADRRIKQLRDAPTKTLQTENPVQLQVCPWCGTALDATNYEVDAAAVRMRIRCPGGCGFGGGLPVHLVDEAVYAARPTLIIATVDKFASMPWRPATAALFNRDRDDDVRPPELIVQDELHLISGPLGTLTGLYETAVDALADRPKVIASTATIRRADQQGRHLFDRHVEQFPPAGLDARDSWFAVESPREQKAARRYLGLFTSSTSQSSLLIRVYAALLHQAARCDASDAVRDAYWTLVGYFNSLRLLSAGELQVLDDVQERLEYLATRDGVSTREVDGLTELSSRANAGDIPKRLRELERHLPMKGVLDVLLATNMISVGVDVDRLGLMAVMGQPQTTAEYIQATSRVGRRHPGLVAVMLNSARSRDRSHYENFRSFHSALYREVESTSVTPFSSRARDRGLHAVVVALARVLVPAARPNDAASRIEDFVDELTTRVRPLVVHRVNAVEPAEAQRTAKAFDEFVSWWRDEAAACPGLVYESRRSSPVPALLRGFDDTEGRNSGWPTLWSLRDVDASSSLFLEATR